MDFNDVINTIVSSITSRPLIALVGAGVYLVFLFKKPQQSLKALALLVFGIVVFYVGYQIQDAVFSGFESKESIIEKQEKYSD